jgi:hypothetical protein
VDQELYGDAGLTNTQELGHFRLGQHQRAVRRGSGFAKDISARMLLFRATYRPRDASIYKRGRPRWALGAIRPQEAGLPGRRGAE